MPSAPIACIYRIRNTVSGTFYIGSTINFAKRRWEHTRHLLRGIHTSVILQRSWNKHGRNAFVFEVLEEVADTERLRLIEDIYLMQHFDDPLCANFLASAMDSPVANAEVRDKIASSLRTRFSKAPWEHPRFGKKHSEETKAKIKAKKLADPTRYWAGKARSEETKRKLSEAQKGRPSPHKGKKMSEQGRANVTAAVKRGAESHFYGKRPKNADGLMKSVVVESPDGFVQEYPSLSATREALGIHLPTIIRACRSGRPLSRGPREGWRFTYKSPTPDAQKVLASPQ
jgi:group I intron endonuclease